MYNCQIIKIQTPKKYLLDGLWLGSQKAQTVYIFLHGLGGSLFSQLKLAESLTSKNSAAIVFNNRGFGTINRISKINKSVAKGFKNYTMGFAHEVFTDCVDDIDGAVEYALKNKAKQIYLVGHSTGCQKSVYYLAKRPKSKVRGAILLAPMSDFADMFANTEINKYKKLISVAKLMVKEKRGFELMPINLWPMPTDAQRFLSLFSPDSQEEIFSYASGKNPKILISAKKPLLIILAGNDEYRERPIKDIAKWFSDVPIGRGSDIKIVNKAPHNFSGHTDELKKIIKKWELKFNFR